MQREVMVSARETTLHRLPAKLSRTKTFDRTRIRKSGFLVPPARSRSSGVRCTCSNHPGSNRCSLHGYLLPRQKLRTSSGNKEVIRRALSPSSRRLSLRWWNFRPTPSRLSNMSTA